MFALFKRKKRPPAPREPGPLRSFCTEQVARTQRAIANRISAFAQQLSSRERRAALIFFFTLGTAIASDLLYRGLAGDAPPSTFLLRDGTIHPPAEICGPDSLAPTRLPNEEDSLAIDFNHPDSLK